MHTSNYPYHLCVAQLLVHALVQQIQAGLVLHFLNINGRYTFGR
jgi:hypothetical protein